MSDKQGWVLMYQITEPRPRTPNSGYSASAAKQTHRAPIGISQGTLAEVKAAVRGLAEQRWRTEYEELLAKNTDPADPKKTPIREETRNGGPCMIWDAGNITHMYYAIPAAVL